MNRKTPSNLGLIELLIENRLAIEFVIVTSKYTGESPKGWNNL